MRRIEPRALVALGLAATLPYLNALRCGFTFDDTGMILNNPVVHAAHLPLHALLALPYEPGSLYRPATFSTFWLNQWLTPDHAFGFHLLNIGLHVIATLLLYGLALRLLSHSKSAFLAALLFAVHPIHTEAVTSIVGRSELLAAIGVLGALLSFERAEEDAPHRGRWLGVGTALFVLGLLSKESTFVCLPLLILIRGLRAPGTLRERAAAVCRRADVQLVGLLAFSYLGFRLLLFGRLTLPAPPSWLDNPLAHTGTSIRLATATAVLAQYLGLLVLPFRLSADYSYNQVPLVASLFDARLLAAAILIASCAVIGWRLRRTQPVVLLGMLFFVAALSLTANFLFPIGTIKAERLLYLPSAGLCLIAGDALRRFASTRPKLVTAAATAAIVLLAGRTWVRNADWYSNLTLFRATVAAAPFSAKAHHNLGVALELDGDYATAALSFRQALNLYPSYDEAAFGIGRTYELAGTTSGALHWYAEALRLNPHYVKALLNRGTILYNHGDFAAAEAAFRSGLKQEPDNPLLLTGLGLTRLARGDSKEATRVLERATSLDSSNEATQQALRLAQEAQQKTTRDSL